MSDRKQQDNICVLCGKHKDQHKHSGLNCPTGRRYGTPPVRFYSLHQAYKENK